MRMRRPDKNEGEYVFTILKNFPKYKSFEVVSHPDANLLKMFMSTFSRLFKGD